MSMNLRIENKIYFLLKIVKSKYPEKSHWARSKGRELLNLFMLKHLFTEDARRPDGVTQAEAFWRKNLFPKVLSFSSFLLQHIKSWILKVMYVWCFAFFCFNEWKLDRKCVKKTKKTRRTRVLLKERKQSEPKILVLPVFDSHECHNNSQERVSTVWLYGLRSGVPTRPELWD